MDAPAPPPAAATERCALDSCGAPVSRATAGVGVCARCLLALYCDRDCQRADWKAGHKVRCEELQRSAAKSASAVKKVSASPSALAEQLHLAAAGDVPALFNVGLLFSAGIGATQSDASAFTWFTACGASKPSPPREVWAKLGECYENGRGVAVNKAEAARLYRVGADAGDASAQFKLAVCHERGIGGPHIDVDAAFALYTAAAAQDAVSAIYNLGACYAAGRGVARNVPHAMTLWEHTLASGEPAVVAIAALNLGLQYVHGENVPKDDIAAARYLRQAAALGDETAARVLREAGIT